MRAANGQITAFRNQNLRGSRYMPAGYMGTWVQPEWKVKSKGVLSKITESQAAHLINKCGYIVLVHAGATTIVGKTPLKFKGGR